MHVLVSPVEDPALDTTAKLQGASSQSTFVSYRISSVVMSALTLLRHFDPTVMFCGAASSCKLLRGQWAHLCLRIPV